MAVGGSSPLYPPAACTAALHDAPLHSPCQAPLTTHRPPNRFSITQKSVPGRRVPRRLPCGPLHPACTDVPAGAFPAAASAIRPSHMLARPRADPALWPAVGLRGKACSEMCGRIGARGCMARPRRHRQLAAPAPPPALKPRAGSPTEQNRLQLKLQSSRCWRSGGLGGGLGEGGIHTISQAGEARSMVINRLEQNEAERRRNSCVFGGVRLMTDR